MRGRPRAATAAARAGRLGNKTQYAFTYGPGNPGLGDLTKVTFADGTTEQFQYDSKFHKTTVVQDQLGNLTSYSYDSTTGDLLTIKNALSQITTLTWSNGLLQTVKDANSHTVSFSYDADRRLQVITDAT